jgi:hypothetical protein
MAWFEPRSWQDEMRDNLARQISHLTREMHSLGNTSGRYAHHLQDDAGELGRALLHSGKAAAKKLGRQAKRTGRAIKADPTPAIAATIAAACLLSLLASRKSSR